MEHLYMLNCVYTNEDGHVLSETLWFTSIDKASKYFYKEAPCRSDVDDCFLKGVIYMVNNQNDIMDFVTELFF